ncbi:hypothetical protein B0T18DRAFT_410648 [Schizothecium vesticola]|uniref:Uncharacterized protein n=1 Tax=Schizothecium vesticola TaxID=314040 RepID=A0AA40K4W0_9PEZI|nr:hypothetical protein B0T18DRAFT_410648 [Schizothecium vesticola]
MQGAHQMTTDQKLADFGGLSSSPEGVPVIPARGRLSVCSVGGLSARIVEELSASPVEELSASPVEALLGFIVLFRREYL